MHEITFADIRHLEGRLHMRREELLDALRAGVRATRDQDYLDLAGQVHDIGDEAVADVLRDIQTAGFERELRELHDVEAALTRVADGSFGRCIDCADAIDRRRLLTFPTAKRCLSCQRRHETRRAGGADASPSL